MQTEESYDHNKDGDIMLKFLKIANNMCGMSIRCFRAEDQIGKMRSATPWRNAGRKVWSAYILQVLVLAGE